MGSKPIDPGHGGVLGTLRIIGPILAGGGLLLVVIGLVSVLSAFGSAEPPKYFWLVFLGLPFLFVGSVMIMFGFLGKVARFQAQELAPVAKDTFNYMAEGTRDGVKTMAGAVGEGLSEGGFGVGGGSSTKVRCHKCNALLPAEAKFCSQCGQAAGKTKPCPQCRELNDPDARFCDNCGREYV